MKKHKLDDLNKMYNEGELADREIFGEMRSNLLLIAGEHYTRKNSRYWNRLRENTYLSKEQKLRLVKNHIQKIYKTYVNNIISHAPGVAILPNNEKETQDQKAAELADAVWKDAKRRLNYKERVLEWAEDFCGMGEVATKIHWDEDKGDFVGYEQEEDQDGNPVVDENGEPKASDEAVMAGELRYETIHGFNLIRPRGISNMDDARWLGIRKMVHVDKVKAWVKDDPEKLAKITESVDETYYVFEGSKNGYDKAKDHVLVIEYFFKPCKEYPQGYYYIATKNLIVFEGELPFGIFPIVYQGFDSVQTSPRHRSIIKQLRPYQVEVNRSASKIAEHQVTLGDDKLLVQSGTKITNGVNLPGIRSLQYTGKEPIILHGRAGEQYVGYMTSQIEEMYRVANVMEDSAQKEGTSDPFGQLFRSMRDKKRFTLYSDKFERYLVKIAETYLKLAREYYDESQLIPAVGRAEHINISEFKNANELSFSIKLEPRTDDIETMMGKQLVMNHALQYVGGQLETKDIGKILRNMPFGNMDESFNDLTIDYDMASNMILALDRGEQPEPNPYDDHTYMIKRLVHRIRQADFRLLDPQIQQTYNQLKDHYESLEVEQQRKILAAQNEFIPTGGAKVKVDFYVPKVGNPDKTERATLPAEAVNWLVQRLEDQGSSQERMTEMNQGAVEEMSAELMQSQGQGPPQGFR